MYYLIHFINFAVTSSLAPSLSSSEISTKSRLFNCGRFAMVVGLYAFLLERGLQCRVRRDSFRIFFSVSSRVQSSSWLQCRYNSLDRGNMESGNNLAPNPNLSPLSAVSPPSGPSWVNLLKERSSQERLVIPIVSLYFCMLCRTLLRPEREMMELLDSLMFRALPP